MSKPQNSPYEYRVNDILLDPPATGKLIGGVKPISVQTLAKWRCLKTYNLPYTKVGREVRYWQSDVHAFLREREQRPTK